MGAIGDRLREAREAQNLSLEQVEKTTHIRRVFLQALEEERYEILPGDVYVKGFLRNYARFLNLDAEEIVNSYRLQMHTPTSSGIPQVLDEPLITHITNGRKTLAVVIIVAALLGVAGWLGYGYFYRDANIWPLNLIFNPRTAIQPTAEPTQALVISQPTDKPAPTDTPVDKAAVIATEAPTAAPTAQSLPTQTLQPTNTRWPTLEPSATATGNASETAVPTTGIRVEARILATSYVRVMADNNLIIERNLRVGEDQVWEANSSIAIRVGNGAGVSLTVNGVEVSPSPVGAQGEVVDLSYTLDNLPTIP